MAPIILFPSLLRRRTLRVSQVQAFTKFQTDLLSFIPVPVDRYRAAGLRSPVYHQQGGGSNPGH